MACARNGRRRIARRTVDQLKLVEPLTIPTAHGGSASDAFDFVIPSVPG
jgi:hypothetical protein